MLRVFTNKIAEYAQRQSFLIDRTVTGYYYFSLENALYCILNENDSFSNVFLIFFSDSFCNYILTLMVPSDCDLESSSMEIPCEVGRQRAYRKH